jgi:SpoVK/Ycf46/Vps4 family AAA+-type ATPase
METTIVPQFLTKMDGAARSGAITVLATNRPDTLDPAVFRDGRLDFRVELKRPDQKATADIARLYLGRLPLSLPADEASELLAKEVFSDRRALGTARGFPGPGGSPDERLMFHHTASGALVKGIVDRAAKLAIRRAKAAKRKTGSIDREDVLRAVQEKHEEALVVGHDGEAEELLGSGKVRAFEPLKSASSLIHLA